MSEKWLFSDTQSLLIRVSGCALAAREARLVRQTAVDELDELTPPPPAPLRRPCSKPGCRRTARPGGRHCRPCATEATRAWRERHRDQIATREQARTWSDEARLVRIARAYVAVYLRRGKIRRGRCETCGDPRTTAAWDNPRQPLEVRWFCRAHYDDRREAKLADQASRTELAEEWAQVRDQLSLLPPAVQTALHEAALKGPFGRGVQPGSIFYWWTLRRELARYRERRSEGRSNMAP